MSARVGSAVHCMPLFAWCQLSCTGFLAFRYCPQFDVLLPYLTIEETLWLYAALRGIPSRRRREEVAELMSMVR